MKGSQSRRVMNLSQNFSEFEPSPSRIVLDCAIAAASVEMDWRRMISEIAIVTAITSAVVVACIHRRARTSKQMVSGPL